MHDYARFSAQVFFHTKNKLKTRITNLGFLAGCFTSICEPKREKDLVLLLKAILLGFMQKQFFELLMKAASDYGALTAAVTDFQWSQNFKEPPSVWGEMLHPIPVALASCTRFFEAMSATRESFATLQNLRVGHFATPLPTTPAKDPSHRAIGGDSEHTTLPAWKNEMSFLIVKIFLTL
ncbi:hypothetical protein ERO13_D10G109450v2 [Gossypium hirsutum]|uniref:AUGMIN subunit 2 n=4 Tax=Gossypium TaxID=3633 RepID=A0A1U8KBY1_GOSHI|nr:AUGMIN subunit 2-like [Gossypium hirsutum]KAB2008746.1 hypothetical protein ES319_D10G119100v1 [Gossypium barbadense]KAG4125657.1 hypothetical protein ERO13_D10G109450v2 [Gossypium hirsutum]TYG49852.1 hypothetical protein ES288_D10G127200v1 [Gossypium darwinii]TYI60727.1 hypothetical protein E1A91_D10G123700v1 [Gossypium mustelinum]